MPDAAAVIDGIAQHASTLRGFGVRRLALFGSVARGDSTADSDLDFLVELERQTFDAYMDTKLFLEDLFQCRIDLIMIEALKPGFKEQVLAEAIYAKGF